MIDILPTLMLCTRHAHPDKKCIRLWCLVLAARRFLYREEAGPRLLVAPAVAHLAVKEIVAYEDENQRGVHQVLLPDNSLTSYGILVVFFGVQMALESLGASFMVEWELRGRLDSGLVLSGAWHRCLTALFLHADSAHVLSNGVALAILMPMMARWSGSGPAWWFFLAAGGAGNALNAWAHGPGHLSVGASTGVFGVIGALAISSGFSRSGPRATRILVALGVGLSLLALLGAEGERTDLGAHFFGFGCGAALGLLSGLLPGVWARVWPQNVLWGGIGAMMAAWACVRAWLEP